MVFIMMENGGGQISGMAPNKFSATTTGDRKQNKPRKLDYYLPFLGGSAALTFLVPRSWTTRISNSVRIGLICLRYLLRTVLPLLS